MTAPGIMEGIDLLQFGWLAVISMVSAAGALLQSASGFGFGLLVIPFFLYAGIPLPQSVMLAVVTSAVQKGAAVSVLRRSLRWHDLRLLLICGLLALPAGVWLMSIVSGLGRTAVKQVTGAVILLLLLLRRKGKSMQKAGVPKVITLAAGVSGGLLNGFANIGGPPVVLWVLRHNWGRDRMRGSVMAFSLVFVPFQIMVMAWVFGSRILVALLAGLAVTPCVLAGTWAGLKLGSRLSVAGLRCFMEWLLVAVALSILLGPLL